MTTKNCVERANVLPLPANKYMFLFSKAEPVIVMFDAVEEKIPRLPVAPEDANALVTPVRLVKSAIRAEAPKPHKLSVEKMPIPTTPDPADVPPPVAKPTPAATELENVFPDRSEIPDAVEPEPLLNE